MSRVGKTANRRVRREARVAYVQRLLETHAWCIVYVRGVTRSGLGSFLTRHATGLPLALPPASMIAGTNRNAAHFALPVPLARAWLESPKYDWLLRDMMFDELVTFVSNLRRREQMDPGYLASIEVVAALAAEK